MRQLKFRGKQIDNKEWVYGYYVKGVDRHCIVMSLAEYPRYDVNPETVGEYTGLNDEYGNEIYEGADFYMGNDKGIVSFENGMFVVDWQLPVTWGLNRLLYQIHDQGSADERVKEE